MDKQIIYIGRKGTTVYVTAALISFEKYGTVRLKARGKIISKAVDVAEIIKEMRKGIETKTTISTQKVKIETEKNLNVSCIEIELWKILMGKN